VRPMASATKEFTIIVKNPEDAHDPCDHKKADDESKLKDDVPKQTASKVARRRIRQARSPIGPSRITTIARTTKRATNRTA